MIHQHTLYYNLLLLVRPRITGSPTASFFDKRICTNTLSHRNLPGSLTLSANSPARMCAVIRGLTVCYAVTIVLVGMFISTLKRVKNELWSIMGQNRFISLRLLVHYPLK